MDGFQTGERQEPEVPIKFCCTAQGRNNDYLKPGRAAEMGEDGHGNRVTDVETYRK